ncbi:MAG: HAMP domain-containing protein [Deltaproteobacteria bacterium]|nr:HAMP domain-containing protein [Deltaproteobacteria bacterium]
MVTLVLFATLIAIVEMSYFRDVLQREALERGKAIAVTLSAALVEMPDSAVKATLESVKREGKLAYIEVVSSSGTIIAHTFESRPPLQDPRVLRETNAISSIRLDDKPVFDVPDAAASGAIVHVGVDPTEINDRLHEAQLRLTLVTLIALGVAALIALTVGRRLTRPLRRLTLLASRVVEGDLTVEVDAMSDDEVGELAAAFTLMIGKLKTVLSALQESVKLLSESARDLGSSTSEQSQTITRQATALQETQVTAQEIKQTSLLAAQKAETVIRLAEKADQVSSSGETAIERSLGGLTDIRAQVDEIAHKIAQLSERTAQIGGITQTVKDLADQSNMLALNAAIEAVRSGEHGKGFAVVAREIRSLADQSIQATNRVREILDDIGGAIRGAVAMTERGSQRIEGGLLQVKTSGENMKELSQIVKDNSAAVRQIAAAVSQQNAGITQIFGAVTEQTRMMDETMQRLESTTQAADTLKGLAQRVSELIKGFRL